MSLACVTMVYNEAVFLPIWLRHYAGQVGASHCYVIDHGSDDGSTDGLVGVNVIRLPRSPHDDARRARLVSHFCAGLLEYYDRVLHSDVDEIVVADPTDYPTLADYAGVCPHDVVSAVGLNLLQLAEEAAFDPARPVLSQRSGVAFSSALCKPVLTSREVTWSPGFHCADAEPKFDRLFLFHLRYFDRATALARLAKTRAMPWADQAGGAHQRVGDGEFIAMLDNFARMLRRDDVVFDVLMSPMRDWLRAVTDSRTSRAGELFTIDLQLNCYEIWSVPPEFRALF